MYTTASHTYTVTLLPQHFSSWCTQTDPYTDNLGVFSGRLQPLPCSSCFTKGGLSANKSRSSQIRNFADVVFFLRFAQFTDLRFPDPIFWVLKNSANPSNTSNKYKLKKFSSYTNLRTTLWFGGQFWVKWHFVVLNILTRERKYIRGKPIQDQKHYFFPCKFADFRFEDLGFVTFGLFQLTRIEMQGFWKVDFLYSIRVFCLRNL